MRLACILSLFLMGFVGYAQSSSNQLFDFDKKSSRSYLKEHRVVSGIMDTIFSIDVLKTAPREVWLKEVNTNFMEYCPPKGFSLRIKQWPGIYEALVKHKKSRVYFWLNETTGTPEFIGYSKAEIVYPELSESLQSEASEDLIDFSKVDKTQFQGTYIVGSIDPVELDMLFPLLHKKSLFLVYPEHLWGAPKLFSYGDSFTLKAPLSVAMLSKLRKSEGCVVLKKDQGLYEIVGFISESKRRELFEKQHKN